MGKSKNLDLWLIKIQKEKIARYLSFLTNEEIFQSKQFLFEEDKVRFIHRRGVEKELLGKYLNMHPRAVMVTRKKHQKPFLPGRSIFFNTSSSHRYVLFAFSRVGEVGVDIEHKKNIQNISSLLKSICSKREAALITSQKNLNFLDSFFRIWTQKEAFLKALGFGLSIEPVLVETPCLKSVGKISINTPFNEGYVQSFTYAREYQISVAFKSKLDNTFFFTKN